MEKDLLKKGENLKKSDLKKVIENCTLSPPLEIYPSSSNPNLESLSLELVNYSNALKKITNAEDKQSLQGAFNGAVNSIVDLNNAVRKKALSDKKKEEITAIASVIYKIGELYLDQRRYEVLKTTVNAAHPTITKAAKYLAITSEKIHQKKLSNILSSMENKGLDIVSINEYKGYESSWIKLNEDREEFLTLAKDNPNDIYFSLVQAHKSLMDSLNNPSNPKQLKAAYKNAKDFYDIAKSASEKLNNDSSDETK